MRPWKVRDIAVVAAAAVGAVIGSFTVQRLMNRPVDFDAALVQMASELNKSLPMMVDKETRLDSTAAGPGRTFFYRYTLVNAWKDDIDADEIQKMMRPVLINNYRTQESMKTLREQGVTLRYNYADRDGVAVTEIVITPEDLK